MSLIQNNEAVAPKLCRYDMQRHLSEFPVHYAGVSRRVRVSFGPSSVKRNCNLRTTYYFFKSEWEKYDTDQFVMGKTTIGDENYS